MKKLICASLIIAAAVCFSGCGTKVEKQSDVNSATTAAAVTEETAAEDDTYAPLATVRERNIVSAEEYDYEIYEGGAIITKYKGSDTDIVIPAEIGGAPVTEVGFYAFEADHALTSVTLPESIKVIGEGAFADCQSLMSINLPEGLQEIEVGAFAGCINLPELTIPASVTRIQGQAFTACTGMTALTVLSTELKYEGWGLEELPGLTVYAPEGSAAAEWAGAMGKYAVY
ncbi:leucine-rich repeat domain-containing protein [uncultured Ruminococcus sp.]|uniref:leucine-rich repeat domain-containing protein n=1 Tax=uncultured Ruminococcus sp. TaxID=165186 RepID=UPI00261653B4|nr:leucine-rich repeat domain-containing protein [uncultured Ruminococcus sp.]